MKVHFTKKDYRLLLDMIYISDWVMHAHDVGEKKHADHYVLRNKLLSYYKDMGASDLVEYSKTHDAYYERRDFEDEAQERFIQPYNTESFWEELVDKLAERDVVEEIGLEKYNALEGIKRITLVQEASEVYEDEFFKNGLKNFRIDTAKTSEPVKD